MRAPVGIVVFASLVICVASNTAGLGYVCTSTTDCADDDATCSGEPRVCTCNTASHYDVNGVEYVGGTCQQSVKLEGELEFSRLGARLTNRPVTPYVHLPQSPLPLGGSCPTTDACITDNSVCSDNRRCECNTPRYQQVDGKCKIDLGYACTATADCADDGATCSGEPRVCTCNSNTHHDDNGVSNMGGTCLPIGG